MSPSRPSAAGHALRNSTISAAGQRRPRGAMPGQLFGEGLNAHVQAGKLLGQELLPEAGADLWQHA